MNLYKRAWLFRENTVVFDKGQVKNVTDEEFREVTLFEPAIKPKILVQDKDVKIGGITFKAGTKTYKCERCWMALRPSEKYCHECGVALDWSVEE